MSHLLPIRILLTRGNAAGRRALPTFSMSSTHVSTELNDARSVISYTRRMPCAHPRPQARGDATARCTHATGTDPQHKRASHLRAPEVRLGDGAEALLPSSVPDLQLDLQRAVGTRNHTQATRVDGADAEDRRCAPHKPFDRRA
jgi:hypothetical protein